MKNYYKNIKQKAVEVENAKEIGEVIKTLRKQQKTTQDKIAGISNVGNRFIVELEAGKPTLQIDKVIKVLNRMGISIKLNYLSREDENDK